MIEHRDFKRRRATTFARNEEGNAAMIFGIAFVPMMMALGVATDYQRMASTKSQLQQAVDVATLSVAAAFKNQPNMSASQAQGQAQNVLTSQSHMSTAQIVTSSISSDKSTFCATASVSMTASFMKIAGFTGSTPKVTSCAKVASAIDPNTTFEVALVLDNSGSMAEATSGTTKIASLKTAAASFINTVYSMAGAGKVQMSVTPFASGVVAVDPTVASNRTLSWIDTQGNSSLHWIALSGKSTWGSAGFQSRFDMFTKLKSVSSYWDWGGCFEDQPYPMNVQDTAPDASSPDSLFVPYLSPDEPTVSYGMYSYSNNYLVDPSNNQGCNNNDNCWAMLAQPSKYKSPQASNNLSYGWGVFQGPNAYCPDYRTESLMRLTTTQANVLFKLNGLVANGNTNLHQGFMWGWRTLSPNAPFADGKKYNTQNNRKVMVFMTDGFNAWNSRRGTSVGSTYQPLGYYSYDGTANRRFPDGSGGNGVNYQSQLAAATTTTDYYSTSRRMLDDITLEACTNAKAQGIEIYTIGFSIPSDPIDAEGLSLLQSCATNTAHYFPVQDAVGLNTAFSNIGASLSNIRLSQ